MFFDYRMVNLYSRKSFRDQLDDTECSNWISLWLQSYQKPPETLIWVLDLKDPVPWINFKAICYLEFFLMNRKNPIVFEYGSGASTLWFAKRASKVESVENDEEWYKHISQVLREKSIANVNYKLERAQLMKSLDRTDGSFAKYQSFHQDYINMHFENYVNSILKTEGKYDLIFIDGVARSACLELAISKIKEDGIIVFDNSARQHYSKAFNSLLDWEIIKFTGPLSYGENIDETTILYKKT